MVQSWPFSPGCDAAGTVVSTGANANSSLGTPFKEGDRVFGCTRLGTPGHSPWAEYFLISSRLTIPVPPNLSLEEASTLGAALLTASLGIFSCLNIPLPNPATALPQTTESMGPWALVLGGASSVGFAAVQLLIASGFRVVATCSERSNPRLEKLGVKCVSYALAQGEVIAQIVGITGAGLECVFDAVGMNGEIVPPLLDAIERSAAAAGMQGKSKLVFTTTNAYTPLPAAENLVAKAIQLGPIGQPDPEASALNDALTGYIPMLYKLLESGKVGVGSFQVEGEGIEGILNAWEVQKSGNVAGKVVVKVAKE